MRLLIGLGAAALAAIAMPAVAHAAPHTTVYVQNNVLIVEAEPGKTNNITVGARPDSSSPDTDGTLVHPAASADANGCTSRWPSWQVCHTTGRSVCACVSRVVLP